MSSVFGIVYIKDSIEPLIISGQDMQTLQTVGQVNNIIKHYCTGCEDFIISFDQSTTCTGICMSDKNGLFWVHLDLIRGNTDKNVFPKLIDEVTDLLIKGLRCSVVLMEKPLFIKSSSTRVLQRLAKHIRHIPERIPSLNGIKVLEYNSPVWKSCVMDKSKGKYRSGDKRCIAEDITDILPHMSELLDNCQSKDYDCFDATGILLAYKYQYKVDEDNYNNFPPNYTGKFVILLRFMEEHNIINFLENIYPVGLKPTEFKYNNCKTLIDNCKNVSYDSNQGYLVIDDVEVIRNMRYELESFKEGMKLIVVVVRDNKLEKPVDGKLYKYEIDRLKSAMEVINIS